MLTKHIFNKVYENLNIYAFGRKEKNGEHYALGNLSVLTGWIFMQHLLLLCLNQ